MDRLACAAVRTFFDFDAPVIFAIPVADRSTRMGILLEGPQGWGEFSPNPNEHPSAMARHLTAALEPGTVGWPDPIRGRVPVACTVADISPSQAHSVVAQGNYRSADVIVATDPESLSQDVARVEAVRDAVGPDGAIRCLAADRWPSPEVAVAAITTLDAAARGLAFIAPAGDADEFAWLRTKVDVAIAAIAGIQLPPDAKAIRRAADVVILPCERLGGVRRALRLAEEVDLPCVPSTQSATSIGLAAVAALAGALPDLPLACSIGDRSRLTADLVARPLTPQDGYLPVPPTTSAPDPELLRHYVVTDEADAAQWRAALQAARVARAG